MPAHHIAMTPGHLVFFVLEKSRPLSAQARRWQPPFTLLSTFLSVGNGHAQQSPSIQRCAISEVHDVVEGCLSLGLILFFRCQVAILKAVKNKIEVATAVSQ